MRICLERLFAQNVRKLIGRTEKLIFALTAKAKNSKNLRFLP
jgi:hypothetical protein